MRSLLLATSAIVLAASASAATFDGVDLGAVAFSVDSITPQTAGSTYGVAASGTSNGVGWTLTTEAFYIPYSSMDEAQSYVGIAGGSFDDVHISRQTTISFDRPIDGLLLALANDNDTGDGPNFGIAPDALQNATADGAQIAITNINGALVNYNFAATTRIVHVNTNGVLDGFDMSFFARAAPSPVPLPAALPLSLAAFAGIALLGRRRR